MFSLFNGIYDSYLAPSQLNLLIVGAPDSGKTAFLERLKVTEIPTRPRKGSGGNKTVQQRIGAEELTATLQDVLIETGAMEGRRHHRTSSMASFGENSFNNNNFNSNNNNNNNSIHKLSTKTTTAAAPASSAFASALISTATGVATTTAPHTQPSSQSPTEPSSSSNNNSNINVQTSTGSAVVVTEKKRRFSICPAPERYSKSTSDEDDDFIMDDTAITNDDDNVLDEETEQLLSRNENSISNDNNNTAIEDSIFMNDSFSSIHTTGEPPQRVRCHSKEFDFDSLELTDGRRSSMQEIMLDHSDELIIDHQHQHHQHQHQQQQMEQQQSQPPPDPSSSVVPLHQQLPIHLQENPSLLQKTTEDYDLKSKSKMLPLRMIRPTIGTNLAKIDMYGAKCHIFDVGGRLQALWERYYDDCDAVIFCWKLGEDPDKPPHQRDDDDDDDNSSSNSDDKEASNIYKEQQEMLNQVRNSIPDDVPFLIIGHIFGNASVDVVDRMYTTDLLLPRYHNPMTGFCCGSAKTGAGIKSSMEWLIPLAKRQQKERIAARRELELLEGGEKEL